jgi:hypothetical protein
MYEFLRNKCFVNKKSLSYNLIPEKDDFLKGKCPTLAEFLKNKNFVKEKSPSFARILEKYSEFLRM